ncbi:glutamate receptor ionotropic, NMDA 2B-like [Hydractinia symbiolongicarpus]|uniref:glutamate receptor ionotropic, NMDA 2B-like n=1 Tax=Hydractinia symbiolongicarpus TaxID=13093 RepID=UPI00254E3D66|nr:glutamate receptor ionotropic, NMDA 2B-like [Hydractinia symbiolongicarpus]
MQFSARLYICLSSKHDESSAYYQVECGEGLTSLMMDSQLTHLSILVHNNCSHFAIRTLTSELKRKGFTYYCTEIYKDQISQDFSQVVENVEMMLLLLSPFDANILLEKMNLQKISTPIFVTTGIPIQIFTKMKSTYKQLRLINLENKRHDRLLLNRTEVTRFAEAYDLTETSEAILLLRRYSKKIKDTCVGTTNLDINLLKNSWRVVSVIYKPFCTLLSIKPVNHACLVGVPCNVPRVGKNKTSWEYSCCSGMAVDLFNLIAQDLNIRFEMYIAIDGEFGGFNNGTWNGIINDVYSGKADVGIQGLTPTYERSKVVDFSVGILSSKYVVIRRKELKKNLGFFNWTFLEPLDTLLLIAIFLSAVIIQFVLFIFENVTTWVYLSGQRFAFQEAFAYTAGLVFQRDIGGENPTSNYGRVCAICFAVTMTVVMSTYTAKLTANGINNSGVDDFKGFTDPKITNPSPAFSFGTMANTSMEMFFKHHPSNYFQDVYNFMKTYSVADDEEGVSAVVSG